MIKVKELEIIAKLLPFFQIYPRAAPTIFILGVTSSLTEGLGISLLIPFLQSLDGEQLTAANNNPVLGFFDQLLAGVNPDSKPFTIAAMICALILLKVLLGYFYTIQVGWFNSRIIHRIRCDIFAQFMSVGQQFWDQSRGGDLLNTLYRETASAGHALSYLIWLVITACMIVIFTVLLLLISWPLTLSAVLAMGLISLLVRRITRQAESLGQQHLAANIQLSQTALETINGIRTIRAFGCEPYEQKQFARYSQNLRDTAFRLSMLSALIEPIFEGLAVILLVGLMLFTLFTEFSLPVLVTMIFMFYRLQPLVKKFDADWTSLLAINSSLDKVQALLTPADKPYIRSGSVPYTGLKDAIRLRSVGFSYSTQDRPALQHISITLRRGETTALVGPSGAGKSTLISLICRFYDATEGQIEVDDQPLTSLKLTDWRDHIALVSQQIHIFNTTIGDNIAYGRIGATEADIIAAATQANAHEFICELPEGYNTQVGDRGVRLSGGQSQRISIARAILRNPDILILDEATNALDSLSEHLIQEALYRLSHNRTVLVIAHRLSTIKHADQIVVLSEGQVKEVGTFDELLNHQDLFAQLYQLQHKPNW
ncbi:ABC transporter ATP-binding protein [Aphanothece hegewaldii CCALA 016]|uniref:ABC transporter ATP-binding protein n=1 Tax=Aphanothece hegewaldii CCALA 016 TaxID=2107694 RepID=A0A2T1M0Q9_9CHRO|nr:ABC transporter ATP-binding protein [Aphanothece hegewaldii]PSF38264.1 ABC transporter ATP-binding protein [Aphanothece hegewaldii CCALA 016]